MVNGIRDVEFWVPWHVLSLVDPASGASAVSLAPIANVPDRLEKVVLQVFRPSAHVFVNRVATVLWNVLGRKVSAVTLELFVEVEAQRCSFTRTIATGVPCKPGVNTYAWKVPDVAVGRDYFVSVRHDATHDQSLPFMILPEAMAPPEPAVPVAETASPPPRAALAAVASSASTPVAPSTNTPVAPSANTPVAPPANTPVALSGNTPVAPHPVMAVASSTVGTPPAWHAPPAASYGPTPPAAPYIPAPPVALHAPAPPTAPYASAVPYVPPVMGVSPVSSAAVPPVADLSHAVPLSVLHLGPYTSVSAVPAYSCQPGPVGANALYSPYVPLYAPPHAAVVGGPSVAVSAQQGPVPLQDSHPAVPYGQPGARAPWEAPVPVATVAPPAAPAVSASPVTVRPYTPHTPLLHSIPTVSVALGDVGVVLGRSAGDVGVAAVGVGVAPLYLAPSVVSAFAARYEARLIGMETTRRRIPLLGECVGVCRSLCVNHCL